MTREQNLNQLANQKRLEKLRELFFEHELPPPYLEYLRKALNFVSLGKIGCSLITFAALVKMDRPLTMAEFHITITLLKSATPIELGLSLDEYLDFQKLIVNPVESAWLDKETEVMDHIERELQVKNRIIPAGKIIT